MIYNEVLLFIRCPVKGTDVSTTDHAPVEVWNSGKYPSQPRTLKCEACGGIHNWSRASVVKTLPITVKYD
jgi:hypothetical protein